MSSRTKQNKTTSKKGTPMQTGGQVDKIKIGIFVSSAKMADCVKRIAALQDDASFIIAHKSENQSASEASGHFSYMGLEEAIPLGKKMEQEGVEVIISRRGTAHLLRENLNISVLSFPTSDIDMILSLQKASTIGKKILLPAFRNKLTGIDRIMKMLNIEVLQKTYTDSNSLEEAVMRAHQQGCDVVVGGPITIAYARDNGMKTVEVETSDDIISATIEDAKSVANANRKEREIARRYQTIINTTSDGIIAFNQEGFVTVANTKAKDLLDIDNVTENSVHMSKLISGVEPERLLNEGNAILDNIETIDGTSYVFNHAPVFLDGKVVGGVSTFNNVDVVMKAENKVRKNLAKGLVSKYSTDNLIFQSRKMKKAVDHCRLYAKTQSTILITGETGTGKEILAHSIHNLSPRLNMPFVSINCAAFPEQLLESELFGYEEGAFTGSKKGGKPGLFELAHNGTIFLDEISAAPQNVQVRLLRVLQEKEVMRLGSDRLIPIDVRVVAAANQELSSEVKKGNFRDDLYFRLNILRINLPPLRDRIEDIPLLADHFIRQFSKKYHFTPLTIPEHYLETLKTYPWPGNIRQFRNFIVRLTLLCASEFSDEVYAELYEELLEFQPEIDAVTVNENSSYKHLLKQKQDKSESELIQAALREANYNKSAAAKKLGISRTTLWRKMNEIGIDLPE